MRTDPRKVRELLEEYASLIPLAGAPRKTKPACETSRGNFLSSGPFSISIWTCSLRSFSACPRSSARREPSAPRWDFS